MPMPRSRSLADLTPPLRAQLDDMGLTDIGLKLVRSLREVNPTATREDLALYRGREKLIALSLESASDDQLPRLLDHEAVHAIRDLGLFQPPEFDALVRAADDMGLRAQVSDLYPRASGDRLAEEMVSALYSTYRSGTPIPEQPRSILQRAAGFLHRFGLAAPEVTPRNVLRRIETGEIGKRPRTARAPGWESGEDLFSKRPPDPAAQKIRDSLEADGVQLKDRDPTFFARFRSLVEGKEPEEVVRTLSTPVARPDAPSLLALAPDWDQRSQERLDRAIAWASRPKSEGGFGPGPVQTALRNAPELAPPPGRLYDQMLRMPKGHLLWYYLSGMSVDEIAGLTPEQARKYVQYIAATSPGETPFTNLKLGTAVMSEDLRGRPGWVGMRNTSQVERVAQGVGLGGPKTDDFAMEIAQRSRALRDPDKGALPVIDLWQARAYHLPDAQVVGNSDPLFAIIARHTIEDSDALQQVMGPYMDEVAGAPLTLEPNMTQAGLWVLGRENEGLYGKPLATPDFTRGSDYWSAMRQMERGLNEALPSVAATGPYLTVRDLMNPALANELTNHGIVNYEEGRHILTEFATSNTLPGVRTQEILLNLDQLPRDHPVRGQVLNGFKPTAAEVRAGAPRTVPGVYQITRGMFKQAAESGVFDEMAAALMRIPPRDLDVGRINYRAYGSWGGTISPHIDIPTMGRVGGQLIIFPQEVIERIMMGIGQAWRQDMAAANAWSTIGISPADANARIIYLPDVHFDEQVGGSIRASAEELARIAEVTRASGWPTQVVSSPLMSMVKLIDPGTPGTSPMGRGELYAALEDAGYTGQIDIVDAVHTAITVEADPEIGYAALITNPGHARDRAGGIRDRVVAGQSGTYPPHPVGGVVPESDWGGEPRRRFRDAVTSLRRYADDATERLAAAEPWYRRRVATEIGRGDLPWRVDPDLAQADTELTATGGTASNFPIEEDAFARVAAKALGVPPDDESAKRFASFDPRLTINENELLDTKLSDGRTYRQVWTQTSAEAHLDYQALQKAGVTWGAFASKEERIAAAGGNADLEKIIRKWNDMGIDIAHAPDADQVAARHIAKLADTDDGIKHERAGVYDLFRAAWGEQALLSIKYHSGNFTGGYIQNLLAGHFDWPPFRDVYSAFKAIRGGMDEVTKQQALESLHATKVYRFWGLDGPPAEVMRGGTRAMTMGTTDYGPSAIGEIVGRTTRSERLGRKAGWIFQANNDLALAVDTAIRGSLDSQVFDDEMWRLLPAWETEVRQRGAGIPDFQFDVRQGINAPPSFQADELKRHLVDLGMQDGVAEHLMRKFVELRGLARKQAKGELDRVQFYGSRTNLDEFIGKVVPFHYWFSRALRFYGEETIRHPFLLLNYMRLSDGIEDAQNDPGLSARQKGFLRLFGTPLGFTLLMNPDALFGVVRVFGMDTYEREQGGTTWSDPPEGYTPIGGALDWLKQRGFGIYPWLDGTLNLMGAYGNDFEPDLLGLRHKALVGAAVHYARSHLGFDPMGAPYAQAMGQARWATSSFISSFGPDWLAQPVTPRAGNSAQEAALDTLIEKVVMENNPQLTNGDLLAIMSDPDNPEYVRGYETVSSAGIAQQLLNFTLPVQFRMKHDYSDVQRAQVTVVSEEARKQGVAPYEIAATPQDLDFQAKYKAMTGKDWVPADYEDAKLKHDLARAPDEAKVFILAEADYNSIGDPAQRKIYDEYTALLNGEDPRSAGLGEPGRRELANQYLYRTKGANVAIDEVRAQRRAFIDSHPEFAEFKGWQNRMFDLKEQLGGNLAEYRRQASEQNPNAERYFADQWDWITKNLPRDEWEEAFEKASSNANAYLAITGRSQLRSVPGPIPGVPPADITIPNMEAQIAQQAPPSGGTDWPASLPTWPSRAEPSNDGAFRWAPQVLPPGDRFASGWNSVL